MATPTGVAVATITPYITDTQEALPTSTATAVPLPATSTAAPPPRLCSPLQDIDLADLASLVSNPYFPPPPGSDNPHQGVDLAVRISGGDMAVAGHPVQAALAGRIVMAQADRFPYGNALMIETALDSQAVVFWPTGAIPPLAATLAPTTGLTCPSISLPPPDFNKRSLYVLYAHLLTPPQGQAGQQVDCGQSIGQVGSSGNALNPHLHFEIRVGPAGMQFPSMAHYDNSATLEEMGNYCLWRTSGLFQLVDPMAVLGAGNP